MKVLLVGNYENDGQESMQKFAALMFRGLRQAGHEARIVKPRAFFSRLPGAGQGFAKWLGYIDKFGSFPSVLKSMTSWADVVHICDHSNAFYTRYLRHVPHVVTCHDLLAIRSALGEIPQNQTGWTGRQLQRLILKGLAQAEHVACVSETTRRDLLRIVGIPEHRVSRVYNSLNYPYSPMDDKEAASRLRRLGVDPCQSFLLHVGGNQWYKNRLGVLRTFCNLRSLAKEKTLMLVMVGQPWTSEMRQFVVENRMGDSVQELPGIADDDLRALYSKASMMVFLSLQEGFGWPIIEAQACGCPVAAFGRSAMQEVGGKAAIYVDPDNSWSAAVTLKDALERVADFRDASLRNAARFKSGMIDSYISLYGRVCKEKLEDHALHQLAIESTPQTLQSENSIEYPSHHQLG